MRSVLIAITSILFLSACGDEKEAAPQPSLQAEQIVKPVHGQFLAACLSEELLNELISHSVNHERTKFSAMFDHMDCMPIPEEQTFKILSVHTNTVEFTNAKNSNPNGMWAVKEAFRPQ